MSDPWALTYEDDSAALTDERLAYWLLCGVDVRLPNKRLDKKSGKKEEQDVRLPNEHIGKKYVTLRSKEEQDVRLARLGKKYLTPGSKIEQAARAALARLIRKGSPFPEFIREILAALFDPASATVPAGRRIDFVNLKQSHPEAGFEVALHVYCRQWLGDPKEAAVQSAMEAFGLKRRQVYGICRKHNLGKPARRLPDLVR
jgi:hypothetical protein